MTGVIKNLTQLHDTLLPLAIRSDRIHPPITVQEILSGAIFEGSRWPGWWRFIPDTLADQWHGLPEETRIIAYSVAMMGFNEVDYLWEDE